MRYPLLKSLVRPGTTENRRRRYNPAEAFGAALKRYIAAGYRAPEAMRAVWHDVRIGRVARPRTAAQHFQRWAAGRRARNPAALETFDLSSRTEWERAIRAAGGLKIARQDAPDFADLPRHLKGYRRGIAPDELAQQISDATGVPAGQVERAMIRAFHAPRRRGRPALEGGEAWEPERRRRGGLESRPRLTVMGDTFGIRPRSPFKERIHYAANRRRTMSRRRRNQPSEYWDLVRQADALYSEIYRIRQRHFQPMGMGYGRQLSLGAAAAARVQQLGRERSRVLSRARTIKKRWQAAGSPAGNPRANPIMRVSEIRPGDVIRPPERELSLWMRRDASEKGLPESSLVIKVESVREGRPDKRGPWIIISGYLPDEWYGSGRRYLWTFKARPETRWLVSSGGTMSRRPNPRGPRSRYCRETVQPRARFDRRSFRTVISRGHRVVIGCPKGSFGGRRCRTATEAQAILHPEGEGRCPFGSPARVRRNPPGRRARLSTFYDRLVEIKATKGRRAGDLAGDYRHRFRSRSKARGVDRGGWRRMRRGEVVLTGRRPVYARLAT